MGLELGKILTWGKNPIVSRLKSFTFLKIFVFILTKLYFNVYILSVIVKSVMFHVAIKDHLTVAESPKLKELFRKVIVIFENITRFIQISMFLFLVSTTAVLTRKLPS